MACEHESDIINPLVEQGPKQEGDPKVAAALDAASNHYRSRTWIPEQREALKGLTLEIMQRAKELCQGRWFDARPFDIFTEIGRERFPQADEVSEEEADYESMLFEDVEANLKRFGLRRRETLRMPEYVCYMAFGILTHKKTPQEILQDRALGRRKNYEHLQSEPGARHSTGGSPAFSTLRWGSRRA